MPDTYLIDNSGWHPVAQPEQRVPLAQLFHVLDLMDDPAEDDGSAATATSTGSQLQTNVSKGHPSE
jgi:hypothetical protein